MKKTKNVSSIRNRKGDGKMVSKNYNTIFLPSSYVLGAVVSSSH